MAKKNKNKIAEYFWLFAILFLFLLIWYGGTHGWFRMIFNMPIQNQSLSVTQNTQNPIYSSCNQLCSAQGFSLNRQINAGADCNIGETKVMYGITGQTPYLTCCCSNPSNDGGDDGESSPQYDCTDSDNGKFPNIAGNCQDSYHQLGFVDTCEGFSVVKEFYCDADGICQSQSMNCPVGWLCINGACRQPECSTIINPNSQASCDAGYCSAGICTFYPATLVSPARCGCA